MPSREPYPILRRTILPLLGRRITVAGIEHLPDRGPYVLVANHQSYIDPIQVALPLVLQKNQKAWFLTKTGVWKAFRTIGSMRLIQWLGMIPIEADKKADSLVQAQEILRQGGVVGLFPEGTRNKPALSDEWKTSLLKGRTGAARLALTTGLPIIPVGLISPAGLTPLQAIVNFFNNRHPAVTTFGRPLHFSKMDDAAIDKDRLESVTREIMQAISTLSGKRYPY